MNKDKMELEEAIRIMEEWSNSYYKEVGENDDSLVIETVLQELGKLKTDNQRLKDYLSEQGMISDYIKFRKRKM